MTENRLWGRETWLTTVDRKDDGKHFVWQESKINNYKREGWLQQEDKTAWLCLKDDRKQVKGEEDKTDYHKH